MPDLAAQGRVTLDVVAGPHNGQKWSFDRPVRVVVGRQAPAHLRFGRETSCSTAHCELEKDPPDRQLAETDVPFSADGLAETSPGRVPQSCGPYLLRPFSDELSATSEKSKNRDRFAAVGCSPLRTRRHRILGFAFTTRKRVSMSPPVCLHRLTLQQRLLG